MRLQISYETAPYPSELSVSGVGAVRTSTSALHGFTSDFPDDAELLLVGPFRSQATLMSDVGGFGDTDDIELTFDDEAAATSRTTSTRDPSGKLPAHQLRRRPRP